MIPARVNYYEVLKVERSATEAEIRDRFRKLARENHPDRYTGPDKGEVERKFQLLTEAMNVLTNPVRRKQHDNELATGVTKETVDPATLAKRYLSIGATAFKQKDYATAYENFDLAAKHNTQDAKAFYYVALAASRIPSLMRQAVQAIETAVQLEKVNPTYLKEAGMICKRAGLNAKAERYLDEALKWDRDSVELQIALAELRQGKGEGGKGFTLFKKG